MKDGDPIASGYNFDQISVDSVREQSRREAATSLGEAFDRSDNHELSSNRDIAEVLTATMALGIRISPTINKIELSEPYEELVHNGGIAIDSRILRITTGRQRTEGLREFMEWSRRGSLAAAGAGHSTETAKIFLVAATGQGQQVVSKNNLLYGAIQKHDGQTEFFKLVPKADADAEAIEPASKTLLDMLGIYLDEDASEQMLVAVALDPVEEMALTNEFNNAAKVLNEKAAQKEAARCIDDREAFGGIHFAIGYVGEITTAPHMDFKMGPEEIERAADFFGRPISRENPDTPPKNGEI